MEKHMQYLMWVKSKAPVMMGSSSLKRSWEDEELAFAKDIGGGGVLGGGLGFVWPPRSYSCTFWRREFRSAQALGGHMNVHRRDRAKLKQSLTLSSNETTPHQKITTPSTNNLHLHPQDGNFSSRKATQENSSGQKCERRKELLEEEIRKMRDYKRHKISGISSSPVGFLHKQCSSSNNNNRYTIQPAEGLRIIKANNNSSLEELDLELRLGDSPAVK